VVFIFPDPISETVILPSYPDPVTGRISPTEYPLPGAFIVAPAMIPYVEVYIVLLPTILMPSSAINVPDVKCK
jgi:hypothetical protein